LHTEEEVFPVDIPGAHQRVLKTDWTCTQWLRERAVMGGAPVARWLGEPMIL